MELTLLSNYFHIKKKKSYKKYNKLFEELLCVNQNSLIQKKYY